MNILLDGYFDKNFGDDIMQRLVIKSLPEHNFFVSCRQREMLAHLEDFKNVHITDTPHNIGAYVNVIGTGFQFNGKRAAAEKLLGVFTSEHKIYPKSAVINCSIEKVCGTLSDALTKRELRKYGLITCRDSESLRYIEGACPRSKIFMHEDISFSADAVRGEGDCLGISAARRIYGGANYEYYMALAKYCDYYAENNNSKIILFAFDSGTENDISAALSVKSLMRYPERAEIEAYNSDTESFMLKMSCCSRFIGSRFHSVAAALRLGIPVIAVSDTEKLSRLCEKYAVPVLKREKITAEALTELAKRTNKPASVSDTVMYDARGHIRALRDYLWGEGTKK